MKLRVPNLPPTVPANGKLAIIGEYPDGRDSEQGAPFVSAGGNLLGKALAAGRAIKGNCFLGHVSQFTLPNENVLKQLQSWEVTDGLEKLQTDLANYKPNCVLLLGEAPLYLAGVSHKVKDYRGSLFVCRDTQSPFYGYKCLASYSPTFVMRSYKDFPLLQFDCKRAVEESLSSDLVLPVRNAEIFLSTHDIISRLRSWPKGHPASIDIEGTCDSNITCIAIASSPFEAFVIDWRNMLDTDKPIIFDALFDFLTDKEIPKVAQNALYENFVLPWKHKTPIHNVAWDTLLSGWEIFPELLKGLATQTSIWTREPYYKNERTTLDNDTHLRYCAKDAMVTYEIMLAQKKVLELPAYASRYEHFKFNTQLLPALTYCQLRGIRYDQAAAKEALLQVEVEQREWLARVHAIVGFQLNINSPKQMNECLYRRMGYKPQYKYEKGRKTTKLTADANALLTLLVEYDSDLVYAILKWRSLQEDGKQLKATVDHDGRIRTSYTLPGTDTGRLASSESYSGSGYNLQTTRKHNRKFFTADPGKFMFQIDLSGADGWTVAAHSANLGDDRMLEDYLYGVKPAKVIATMYLTGRTDLANMRSHEVQEVIKATNIPEWLYAACKAVQHGTNYNMAERTMSVNILRQSWKFTGEPVNVPPAECRKLQQLYILRYPGVARWQNWVKLKLQNEGQLHCASGHIRRFMGRLTDNATYQSALSHEPQANTTYATNLALLKLLQDPTNRTDTGAFICEPLHQVHDALIGQFPQDDVDASISRLQGYFRNELLIANRKIIIPFEGEYGLYWGDKSGGLIAL